jgi:hypothetical protein
MSNLGSRLFSVLSRNGRLVGILTISGLAVSAGLYLITRGAQTTAATTDATQTGDINGDDNDNEKEEEEEEDEDEDLNNEEDEEENIAKLDDDDDDTNDIDETRNDQTMIVRVNSGTMTRPQVIALVSLYANTVMCYVFAVMAAIEARRELPHFAVPVAWTGVGALVGILVQFFRRQGEGERELPVRDRQERRQQQERITQENDEMEEEEEDEEKNNVERVISTRKKSPIKMGPSPPSTTLKSPTPRIIERPVTAPTPVALSSAAPARRLEFSTASTSVADAQQMLKFPIGSPSSSSSSPLSSSHRNLEDEEPQPPSVHRPSPSLHKKQQGSPKNKR